HDNKKLDLMEWAKFNRDTLAGHELYATGTTGALLDKELGLNVQKLLSGPLGGDQQIGAMIADRTLDLLVFFWDPLEPQPHAPDVKALLRIAVVWNIPVACNRASADFIISSPLMNTAPLPPDAAPGPAPTTAGLAGPGRAGWPGSGRQGWWRPLVATGPAGWQRIGL